MKKGVWRGGSASFGGPLTLLSPGHGRKWPISLPLLSSPDPKISLFWFMKCKKGIWGKGCGQGSAHTPDIPLPATLPSVWEEADPEKRVMFPACLVHRCWLWSGQGKGRGGPGTPGDSGSLRRRKTKVLLPHHPPSHSGDTRCFPGPHLSRETFTGK